MPKLRIFKYRFTQAASALTTIILVAMLGVDLMHPSHAQVPTMPTIPICGERQSSDVEQYTGPAVPSPAYVNEITPPNNGGIGYYRYWPGGTGVNPRWYIMHGYNGASATFNIYDATNDSLINTATISIPANQQGPANFDGTFALDPSGNMYVGTYATSSGPGVVSQWLWSPGQSTAKEGWSAATPTLAAGGVYGYTDGSGIYRIGFVVQNPSNNGTDYSDTYNSSTGAFMGTNNIDGSDIQVADAHNQDLVVVNSNTNSIEIWNSTATTETFNMSAGPNSSGSWSGDPVGANELANGDIIMTSYGSRQVIVFTPSGGIIGKIGAENGYTSSAPLDSISYPSPVEVENNRIYYVAENPFSSPNKLTYFTTTYEADWMATPQGAPFHLGLGANISTPATDNYFAAGTTPEVDLKFNQWWQAQAANFSGSYTVRNINQILNNQAGTTGTFSIPSSASAYSTNNTASLPLTLPSASPGVYEVNVQLSEGGNVVGADCQVYTVGASNLNFNTANIPSSGDTQGVYLAHAFGQKLFRSNYNIDSCFSGVTTPTTSTPINCSAGEISDIQSAATLAAQDGVTYEIQLGAGSSFDTSAIASSGVWQHLVQEMAAQFPEVTYWECWNEPDNNSFGSASDYVTKALEPCYNAVKSVSSSDKMIGISNDGNTVGNYQNYVNAGALNYLDIVAVHSYTGYNRSFEQQGMIDPSIYQPNETGDLDALKSYLSSKGYNGPIFDTESGFWNNTPASPYNYYDQGDMLVTKMILEQSIGMDWLSNFFNNGGYEVNGMCWELMGCGSSGLNPGGLAALNYEANLGGRTFQYWMPTGIPHTYAALYGPSSSDSNDVVAVWADDYNVGATPKLSGGGSMSVTSEYGVTSTLNSGSTLNLSGQVQYITVPAGQTLNLSAQEAYGTNYALASGGATAAGSSIQSGCNSSNDNPDIVLTGIDDAQDNNTNICGGPVWAPSSSDTNPTLTITLKQPEPIDRLFISSYGLGSILTGLRGYQVAVSSTVGGAFNTVATVSNQYYNRNNLVTFGTQTVAQIQISNMTINYSGYSNGLPPTFWGSGFADNASFYDVEAYSPSSILPSVVLNSVSNGNYIHGSSDTISVTATPNNGGSITSCQLLVNASSQQTLSSAPFNFTFNTLKYKDGIVPVEAICNDNQANSGTMTINLAINNGDLLNSGKIGISDLAIMASHWGQQDPNYNDGNITGQSTINLSDLAVLAANWGWTKPQ